jgi:hypothetical protein
MNSEDISDLIDYFFKKKCYPILESNIGDPNVETITAYFGMFQFKMWESDKDGVDPLDRFQNVLIEKLPRKVLDHFQIECGPSLYLIINCTDLNLTKDEFKESLEHLFNVTKELLRTHVEYSDKLNEYDMQKEK